MPSRACRCALLAAAAITSASVAMPALATAAPPDGRAYELVSPPDKNGAEIPRKLTVQAAPSGDRIVFPSTGAFAGAQGTSMIGSYVANRGGGDWTTAAIDPPSLNPGGFIGAPTFGLSGDLSAALQATLRATVPGATEGGSNILLRDHASGARRLLATLPDRWPAQLLTGFGAEPFVGAADDGSSLVFEATAKLHPDAADGVSNVYEARGGELRLVNRLPDGTVPPDGARADKGLPGQRAVSADGRRIFFRAGSDPSAAPLYMREEGDRTVLISEDLGGDPAPATFAGASRDGSIVFFTSTADLTPGADNGFRASLYRYEVATGDLEEITPKPGGAPEGVDVKSVLQVSEDGSTVAFTAGGVLHPDATPAAFLAANIYVWRDGEIAFAGQTEDAPGLVETQPTGWRLSPNGRWLAFSVFSQMTADTTRSGENCPADPIGGNPDGYCRSVYAFDVEADELHCVSCRPGADPAGWSELGATDYRPSHGAYWGRSVLDDGSVFVNTPNPLLPQDLNGRDDVYRWRGGRLDLITTGSGEQDANFADATPDGRDVFFRTSEQLVPLDTDRSFDLYDARVGGGLPSQHPPTPPAPCSGDGCQGDPSPPLGDVRPGSVDARDENADEREPTVTIAAPTAKARRAAARTGRLVVKVKASRARKVALRATTKLGKRTATVARATRTVRAGATVSVTLRLSKAARRRLAERRALRLSLTAALSGTAATDRASVTLRRTGGNR